MLFNTSYKTINVNNGIIDYIKFGTGKRNLVIISGLTLNGIKGTSHGLAYMYRIFSKDFTVYIFDRICNIPNEYTIKNMAEDLAQAMNNLNIKSANILGISQGGMIGQYLAIYYPELVENLVLGLTCSRVNDTLKQAIETWIGLAEKKAYKDLVIDVLDKIHSSEYINKYKVFIPILKNFTKPNRPEQFINNGKACLTCNSYEELYKISCPTFVIGGEKDKVVTCQASEEIAEILKCKIHIYKNLGHGAHIEAKDFNQRIYDFLYNK